MIRRPEDVGPSDGESLGKFISDPFFAALFARPGKAGNRFVFAAVNAVPGAGKMPSLTAVAESPGFTDEQVTVAVVARPPSIGPSLTPTVSGIITTMPLSCVRLSQRAYGIIVKLIGAPFISLIPWPVIFTTPPSSSALKSDAVRGASFGMTIWSDRHRIVVALQAIHQRPAGDGDPSLIRPDFWIRINAARCHRKIQLQHVSSFPRTVNGQVALLNIVHGDGLHR